MKQRVRVASVVDCDNKYLLVKRSNGRSETSPIFEIPNGKIGFGEQPEDSMVRVLHDYTNVEIASLELVDVITFLDTRDTSEISNLYVVFYTTIPSDKIKLNKDRYSKYLWAPKQDILGYELDKASEIIFNSLTTELSSGVGHTESDLSGVEATVYTDGGSRGNPGPSAAGVYILSPTGEVIYQGGKFLGITDSGQAEYLALKFGIEKSLELNLKVVEFKLDNLMIVSQMNGVYKVKNRELWPIYDEIKKLLSRLDKYSFAHVKRNLNVVADSEANKILDIKFTKSDIL